MQRFDEQRARGTEGFGLFDGQEKHIVKAAKEDKILKWLVKYESDMILFHHRTPTSTINVKRAAHPFSTRQYFGDTQYVMIHNGHISNYRELYADHRKQGIAYQSLLQDKTYNDSEALAWDFALTMEGKQEKLAAKGAIAFICIKLVKGEVDKLYFGRNINPLKIQRTKEGVMLASEGEGEYVTPGRLYTFNYKLKRLTSKAFDIPSYSYYSKPTKGYDYHGGQWNYSQDYPRGEAGDWLPDALRKEFAPYIGTMTNHRDPMLLGSGREKGYYNDYEYRDEHDIDAKLKDIFDSDRVLDEDEIEEEMELYSPSVAQIESGAWDYLMGAHGHFEQAYTAAEQAYQMTQDVDFMTVETFKASLLLEGILDFIMQDPEYENEDSVSSMWEELWAKTEA